MNKYLLLIPLLAAMASPLSAQAQADKAHDITRYDLALRQDSKVADWLSDAWNKELASANDNSRGVLNDTYNVLKAQSMGLVSSTVSSIISTGVDILFNALRSKKGDWKKLVEKECVFEKQISTIKNVNDFYSQVSTTSAMDPSGMAFNGFSCMQMRGPDTVLYVSCHLKDNEIALQNIIRHSKFELELDTLVFSPKYCDLPNENCPYSQRQQEFSFENRGMLNLEIDTKITSSWINQAIQVYKNQELGNFFMKVPINKPDLDADGVFRFIRGRTDNKISDIEMTGDCFIVPRSYIGVRDADGNYSDCWGTGEYMVTMNLKETCTVTPEFEANWKADWKRRRTSGKTIANQLKQTVTQNLVQNGKKCLVTVLETPYYSFLEDVKLDAKSLKK
jgi:hypothetical protein